MLSQKQKVREGFVFGSILVNHSVPCVPITKAEGYLIKNWASVFDASFLGMLLWILYVF